LSSLLVVLALSPALSRQPPTTQRRGDPAVEAYTTFIKGKEPAFPADRDFVIAALDRLVAAVEGIALARNVATDSMLAGGHEIRRDIRRLGSTQSQAPEILKKKADVFVAIGEFVGAVNVALGPKRGAEQQGIDALKRSADGLDFEYPLKWQPDAIQGFLEIAEKVLQQMSTR
jgi:hypothetical protein